MATSFLVGLVTGAIVVGSSVHRTLAVDKGLVTQSILGSIFNSASYYASIYYITKGDNVAYIGTAVGSTIAVAYMAWRNLK